MGSTGTNITPATPIGQRHWPIRFESEDGSVGEVAFPINYEELYNLKGRLLTIVDATFTDPQQRKAMKDVIWQALQAWLIDIERAGGYPAGYLESRQEPATAVFGATNPDPEIGLP